MEAARILIVDDQVTIGIAFKLELGTLGYDVDSVLCGEEAMKAVNNKKYDLALIDKDMPGMDGIETCREIKRISPDTISIFMTGLFNKENILKEAEFVAAGGRTYNLYKPFAPGEIEGVIRKVLSEKI